MQMNEVLIRRINQVSDIISLNKFFHHLKYDKIVLDYGNL